jgi:hypothetical protein
MLQRLSDQQLDLSLEFLIAHVVELILPGLQRLSTQHLEGFDDVGALTRKLSKGLGHRR